MPAVPSPRQCHGAACRVVCGEEGPRRGSGPEGGAPSHLFLPGKSQCHGPGGWMVTYKETKQSEERRPVRSPRAAA